MDMSGAVEGVVVVADTELVRAGTVIDVVEQVSLTQQSERAEERGLVHCRQRVLQVGEAECPCQGTPYLAPYEKPDRSDANSGLLKYLFIRELILSVHILSLQRADGVQYGKHRNSHVCEYCHPQGGCAYSGEQKDCNLHANGEDNILPRNAYCAAGNPYG